MKEKDRNSPKYLFVYALADMTHRSEWFCIVFLNIVSALRLTHSLAQRQLWPHAHLGLAYTSAESTLGPGECFAQNFLSFDILYSIKT